MELSPTLTKYAKGLVEHFAQGGTLEQAQEAGKHMGLPRELTSVFPGMMVDACQFAVAVDDGEMTMAQAVAKWVEHGSTEKDARGLIQLALDTINEVSQDWPIPTRKRPWWKFWAN